MRIYIPYFLIANLLTNKDYYPEALYSSIFVNFIFAKREKRVLNKISNYEGNSSRVTILYNKNKPN